MEEISEKKSEPVEEETPQIPIEINENLPSEPLADLPKPEPTTESPIADTDGDILEPEKTEEKPPNVKLTFEPPKSKEEVIEIKEFVCDFPGCGKAFEREMQLKGHRLHHIKKRGKSKKKASSKKKPRKKSKRKK